MDAKRTILLRIYIAYFAIALFAIIIFLKVFQIQIIQGEQWKSVAQSSTFYHKNIDAIRGNIYASDGNLLATSLPFYDVGMDVNADALSDEIFNDNVDSLAICLS